jgi:hypothetical protein
MLFSQFFGKIIKFTPKCKVSAAMSLRSKKLFRSLFLVFSFLLVNPALSKEDVKKSHDFALSVGITTTIYIPSPQIYLEYILPFYDKRLSLVARYKYFPGLNSNTGGPLHIPGLDFRYAFWTFDNTKVFISLAPSLLPPPLELGFGVDFINQETNLGLVLEIKSSFLSTDNGAFHTIFSPGLSLYYGF